MAKTAVATRKMNLPANWEAKMQEQAAKAKKQVASIAVGQFMSIRGGVLKFQDTPVPGNKMQCVIVSSILENAYYEGDFDPKNPVPPVCYSFGDEDRELAPHEQSEKKQSDMCSGCKWNKFGTADKGKGKACKNGVRLGLVHVDSLKDGIEDSQVAILKIPPTSLKGYRAFVDSLEKFGNGVLFGVVTQIEVVPDPVSQYKVVFSVVRAITDKKLLGPLFMKSEGTQLDFPYQAIEGAAQPAARNGGKKAAKKKAAGGGKREEQPAPARGFGGKQQPAGGRQRF